MTATTSIDDYSQWIGRTEVATDDLSPATAQGAAATFGEDVGRFAQGAELPRLWHWFYFLAKAPPSQLGADGHPIRDERSFLPPVPFPRRMFAGARLHWHQLPVIGRPARREAVIRNLVKKSGRSGEMAFVTVGYRFFQDDVLCLEEEQDIVYREPGPALSSPQPEELPVLPEHAWSQIVAPDTRLLFRFSALTFNAHRIHYDRPYAMNDEGYPGLVVHGPLTAMLLLQLVSDNTPRPVARFSFRSQGPLFDLAPFRIVARPAAEHIDLEAQGPDGKTAMTAQASFDT